MKRVSYLVIALLAVFGFVSCTTGNKVSNLDFRHLQEAPQRSVAQAGLGCFEAMMYQDIKVSRIANFSFKSIGGDFKKYFEPPASKDAARKNIADLLRTNPNCDPDAFVAKQPNIYIYFTGFGGAVADNSVTDEGEIFRWINARDPNSLIVTIGWKCDAEKAAGYDWCARFTQSLVPNENHPGLVNLKRALSIGVPQGGGQQIYGQMRDALIGNQSTGYDYALGSALSMATILVNQILTADLGRIHFLGYSMGAHAAADILNVDYSLGKGPKGFKWTSPNVCESGSETCTIAELKKVKWSLAMGTPGWSHALRLGLNKIDSNGVMARDKNDYDQYENGGLLRIRHPDYKSKLNVFNRRKDPTSISDDTLQRGFNDIMFGDYNHMSHDYTRPAFRNQGFLRMLDAFLEAKNPADQKEIGIMWDNGATVEFDECSPGSTCKADTYFTAHYMNRSHANLANMKTIAPVAVTAGVPKKDRDVNLAAKLTAGSTPVQVHTMDQEDLRGSVEFYYKPDGDLKAGERGLFSYGTCEGSSEDLMPRASVKDGVLTFSTQYQGKVYSVSTNLGSGFNGKWTHLAFSWELPTPSLVTSPLGKTDAEFGATISKPEFLKNFQKHQLALLMAAGLTKAPPTTYREQRGEGTLKIYVNGKMAAAAPLGTASSVRECLPASKVLVGPNYTTGSTDQMYPPYLPYAGYDLAKGDMVSFGQPMGTKCKGFAIRNPVVNFGCSGSSEVTANGAMDDIWIIFGRGRTAFENVGSNGQPVNWPVGVEYSSQPFVVQ